MKKLAALLIAIFAFTATGCYQNRGDIGIYYGIWAVDDVTVDGARVADYPYGYIYWAFQTRLLRITRTDDHDATIAGWYGIWSEDGNRLTLDFDQIGKNNIESGRLPAYLLIPPQQVTVMDILQATSSALRLTYRDDTGATVTFTLRKIK